MAYMYAGSLTLRRANAIAKTKKPTAKRITVNAHDVAATVGVCNWRN